jgi:hypothetical protein
MSPTEAIVITLYLEDPGLNFGPQIVCRDFVFITWSTQEYWHMILSRVYGSVTNNNEFCIDWLDLLPPSLYNLS